ncbi:conserved hypothetical protein [Histoplasma capsulatum H143]|uniref:Piwi domain-containing protein n=1 Tax=Ajellomyces capsulatus (strain H143) TaxID=544712 RepID=C6H5C6_AJECH|nr:conserved hypothetical protein [Histoplasma capsulatum H143]
MDTNLYIWRLFPLSARYGVTTSTSVMSNLAFTAFAPSPANSPKDRNHTYFANVALETNRKLGGASHTLDAHKLGFIPGCKTMVVCVDVTHPSPGSSTNASSGAAIVASIDQNLTQWPAEFRIQATFQKMMISRLDELLKSRLRLWAKQHHRPVSPENVLIYHDAVMEG